MVREVLVELTHPDQIARVESLLARYGARWEKAFPQVKVSDDPELASTYQVFVDDKMENHLVADLKNQKGIVRNAEKELRLHIFPEPKSGGNYKADDPHIGSQWWLPRERVNRMHTLLKSTRPRQRTRVAVIDTGVQSTHEDLASIWRPSPGSTDPQGHGTHVAGLVGASTNNMKGISSFNWDDQFIEIVGYQALGRDGGGSQEDIAQSIIDAVRDGAQVLNLSLGGDGTSHTINEAVKYAIDRGVIVVVAAGNENQNATNVTPANAPGVIVVAAHDNQNRKASFSNTVTNLAYPLAAPGVDILSAYPGNTYNRLDGTSMAAPIIAGVIGVMRAIDPKITAKEAWEIIVQTGTKGADVGTIGTSVIPINAVEELIRRRAGGGPVTRLLPPRGGGDSPQGGNKKKQPADPNTPSWVTTTLTVLAAWMLFGLVVVLYKLIRKQ